MSKTIYIVTGGDYSDYSIYAVFSTNAKAERYAEEHRKNHGANNAPNIEEWELDGCDEHVAKTCYSCTINLATGDIVQEWDFNQLAKKGRRAGPASLPDSHGLMSVGSYVSKEHARKLAAEARQKHLRASAK